MGKIEITLKKEIFNGDILDIGFDNHGIMYRACKEAFDEIAIAYYSENTKEDIEHHYDTCLMFLALKEILFKGGKAKVLNKVKGLLKDDGYIHIWDITKKRKEIINEEIQINLPGGDKKEITIKDNNYIKEIKLSSIQDIVKEYFDIEEVKTYDKIFYIKAKKRG